MRAAAVVAAVATLGVPGNCVPLAQLHSGVFTPDMVHSTLSALKRDHQWYLSALGIRAGRSLATSQCASQQRAIQAAAASSAGECFMNLVCEVGVPLIDFVDCLASHTTAAGASTVFSTDFTTPLNDLCSACHGKTGSTLDACVAQKDAFITDSACPVTVFAPYYENDPGSAHFDALFKDPTRKAATPTLGMVAAICNDSHCYDKLYDSVQALLQLMHDGGSCLDMFHSSDGGGGSTNSTMLSSQTDLGSLGNGMDMARAALRLLCAFSPAASASAKPVSCFDTLETIMSAYNETDTSTTITALCPSTTNNAPLKSRCCMREIMAAAPPMEDTPDFWTDLDAACGLNLADTDPATMLQFCPGAHGSAQSFVIGLHVSGQDVCGDAGQLQAIIQGTADHLGIETSQVIISSCTYSATRTRVLYARRLATGVSDVDVTVTAIGSAQIALMDDCKTAATSPAYSAAIATSLNTTSSSVTSDSVVVGEMSAQGTNSAPAAAVTAGSALLGALLAAAALIL